MGYIQKEWVNPTNIDATDLNRIEKGVKDSHETLNIVKEELTNLRIKHLDSTKELQSLLKNSPNILETLSEIKSLVSDNNSLIETLKDTSNLATKEQLNKLSNSFLHITSIKQDGNNIYSNGEVLITSPTVDSILNRASNNAISNKAVTLALESLTNNIVIPTKLSDLKEDYHHKLITEDERLLWNRIKEVSLEETDPTVPGWAKQPEKPKYEWIEILNTPKIPTSISEFPDVNNYAISTHDHDNRYALLQHEHDNRYAGITHKHLNYSDIKHEHHNVYAELNHTHDFDTTELGELIQIETSNREQQYNSLLNKLSSISMDYNDLNNLPDLTIYALDAEFKEHNHNNLYALLNHTHNYADANHNHDTVYSKLNHGHDYTDIFANINHTHDEYSLTSHNHNTLYSLINHNHSLLYAELAHTHTNYAEVNHNHEGVYAPYSHNHDYSTVYAAINHNHDSSYATKTHTHTEFSSIVDLNTINTLINTAIDELIGGADGTYDTLKDLQDAIKENDSLIDTLNAAIGNKADKTHTHIKSDITDFAHTHDRLNSLGLNIITSTANDTTANWKTFNNGIAWFNTDSTGTLLNDQPKSYGFVLNAQYGTDIHQIWMSQSSGPLFHRGGNGNGWSGTWREVLDTVNYTNFAATKSHTHTKSEITDLYISGNSTGNGTHYWKIAQLKTASAVGTGCSIASLLVSGIGDFGGSSLGTYLITMGTRSGTTMQVTELGPPTVIGSCAFGYITTSTSVDFYIKTTSYNFPIKIIELNNNNTIAVGNLAISTTDPGLTYVSVIKKASESHTHSYLPLSGGTLTGNLNMNNTNITGVNHIQIADSGADEGIEWVGGEKWKIYESSNSLDNTKGNLQFVTDTTRRATISTNGIIEANAFQGRLKGIDTRSNNFVPSDYQTSINGITEWQEFKSASTISAPNQNANKFVYLKTYNPWGDPSGGLPSQLAIGDGLAYRTASSSSAWNAWKTLATTSDLTNYVTLSTAQTISGAKTFSGSITVPDVSIS